MKTIQNISALLAVSASLSMAGVIDIYTDDGKKPSTSLNLTTIDSLTFSGKAEKKKIDFSGKAKQKAIKLADIDRVEFSIKKKSKETMTVEVAEGVSAGKHTYKLSEIKKIEIIETDSDEDKDGDGLTDIEEVYKYDTNPNSTDTDGDGWSDSEELADGMYSPKNPTKFNPRIADVPGLRVTLKKSPSIMLNITTSEGKTESETVTNGSEVSKSNSTSYEESRSTDIMHAWEVSTTQGVEIGSESKYTGSVTLGYNGSYTTSTGMTWNSTEENSVAESYEKSLDKEISEGNEVNGATLCMQVELKNTSDIAFTIEALMLSASIYDIKDTATLKILADLSREGDWSDITLKPGESVEANYCNNDVKVELIEDLIYNTSSIVLGASTQKITIDGGKNDFTVTYTKVVAKTADITIDYGPGASGNQSVRYQVATNYRYNPDNKGSDDMYAKTSLAELLRNAHVDFEQDSVKGPSKKKLYGLSSIEGYKYNLKDSAMWFVTIQRAKDIKKGRNTMELYTFAYASYDLEEIFVGAGDAVHIFYSQDHDHDGVPLLTERLFGTSDKKADTDGDGLSDYEEINGWTKGKSKTKIYTNPANEDTDGDGMNDKEDPEPTKKNPNSNKNNPDSADSEKPKNHRLVMNIRMLDFGGQYHLDSGYYEMMDDFIKRSFCQIMKDQCVALYASDFLADMEAKVSLRVGNSAEGNVIYAWYGYDYDAGYSGDDKDRVIFFSEAEEDKEMDSEDIKPDGDWHEVNVGPEGLYLDIEVLSSIRGNSKIARQGIYWSYEEMVKVLENDGEGTGRDSEAPKQGENRFLVGAGGIKYDDTDGICDDSCGDEPHTGYKFEIQYKWVED